MTKTNVKVIDAATGMSVTYWQVAEADVEATREKAFKELYHRKEQLSGMTLIKAGG